MAMGFFKHFARQRATVYSGGSAPAADVVVTIGCGDSCPILPGRRYEESVLPDPAGLSVADVRPVRDEIERRVRRLLECLGVDASPIV